MPQNESQPLCAASERLASRLGFLLLSAGCAIGLGNVWRFPYVAGKSGGGCFVAFYLLFLLILGIPVLIAEFSVGRAARRPLVSAYQVLTPAKPLWRIHGFLAFAGCVVLMSFYTTVTGWMVLYFLKSLMGVWRGVGLAQNGVAFGEMLANPMGQIWAMLGVTIAASCVCGIGLQKGVERISKGMMLCLFVLIIVLVLRSLTLSGAMKGVCFFLVPDFARMCQTGVARVIVEAMNHAFFTLSIGIGSMAIFGSYVSRQHTLVKEAVFVTALDTFVAIMAGLVILPACFAFGIDSTQGPGLIFVTLPNVFQHVPAGHLWQTIFFLFMMFAAFTTVVAVFECIVASLCDKMRWTRVQACVALAIGLTILALPCILGFNVLSGIQPFGAGSCLLDVEDFIVSNLLLPIGAVYFALYCSHSFGWGWKAFLAEANAGRGIRLGGELVRMWFKWCLPVVIMIVLVIGLLTKFGVITL